MPVKINKDAYLNYQQSFVEGTNMQYVTLVCIMIIINKTVALLKMQCSMKYQISPLLYDPVIKEKVVIWTLILLKF